MLCNVSVVYAETLCLTLVMYVETMFYYYALRLCLTLVVYTETVLLWDYVLLWCTETMFVYTETILLWCTETVLLSSVEFSAAVLIFNASVFNEQCSMTNSVLSCCSFLCKHLCHSSQVDKHFYASVFNEQCGVQWAVCWNNTSAERAVWSSLLCQRAAGEGAPSGLTRPGNLDNRDYGP